MLAEVGYKVSAFGDFLNISPTPDTVVSLVNELKNYSMVPSTFPEMNPASTPSNIPLGTIPMPPRVMMRICLFSENEGINVLIGTNRLDVDWYPKEIETLTEDQYDTRNSKIKDIFSRILKNRNKGITRFALNSTCLLVDLRDESKMNFSKKFSCDIAYYNELFEWSARLLRKDIISIKEKQDRLNVITNIYYTSNQQRTSDNLHDYSGFNIDFDINTVAENTFPRYDYDGLDDFLKRSGELKRNITHELLDTI